MGLSIAFHAALLGLFAIPAAREIIRDDDRELVEFELLPASVRVPEPEMTPEPAPEPETLPVPVELRPERVPEKAKLEIVDKARPFQESAATDTGTRDAPDDTEAVPAPTAPMPEIAMESTVGIAGGNYVTTNSTEGTLGVPAGSGSGTRGSAGTGSGTGSGTGDGGAVANQGAHGIKVSPEWQITQQPEPLNDRNIEPKYPALAKREGREAVVVVQLYIDKTGRVTDARVIEGPRNAGFRPAAIAYAKKLRFTPARAGKRPVASRIEWSVHFYVRN
jgi:protein TonB